MFQSTGVRLAAIFTAGFALAVAILGAVTIIATRSALEKQFDNRIVAEMDAIQIDFNEGGLRGMLTEIRERREDPSELAYGVVTVKGAPVDGPLAGAAPPPGWSTSQVNVGGRARAYRMLARDLPGGYRLIVGDDLDRMQDLSRSVFLGFGLAFVGVVGIGAAGGFAMARAVERRLGAITGTAEAIIDGDLARRVPVDASDDDLARLARTVNRMLDRIGGLMESLRQVSSDVAHDMRTPLNRLRQKLESGLRGAGDGAHRAEIEGALKDVDAILATFAAVLRIAEVEAGARRAAFRTMDLEVLTRTAFEDFAPAAEDAGKALALGSIAAVRIEGDPDLITQMLVNLIENALNHTPAGSKVVMSLSVHAGRPVLSVADDGPGIPAAERQKVLERFYRLERSRSTAGSGLGLALVAAIARLHRAEIQLLDADPGLEAKIVFPGPRTRPDQAESLDPIVP